MYVSLPGDDSLVEHIIDYIKTARYKYRSGHPKSAVTKVISDKVHSMWELRYGPAESKIYSRSVGARKYPSNIVIDHPYPSSLFAEDLLLLPEEDLRVNYVRYLLWHKAGFVWIMTSERERLFSSGLLNRMPDNWDGFDNYARYTKCGISLGEIEDMDRNTLEKILRKPFQKHYVYMLSDPKGTVFYIGKGEGKRVLSHEKEIYKKKFPIHTNWKKLNRIAQILKSGREIRYCIDSWHAIETDALIREEQLILKYEKESSRRLCNSNGLRWQGKPSRSLVAIRCEAGIKEHH